MNKGGLGITLILLPVLIMAMFGFNVYRESQSFKKPRSYTHLVIMEGRGTCSGTMVGKELVLTAFHCTGDGTNKELVIKVSGKSALVLRVDQQNDLSLLSVPGLEGPVALMAARSPAQDEKVIAVGWPLGKLLTVTEGRVMALVEEGGEYRLWTTAPIVFGNSGGGLFEFSLGEWKLVGVTVSVPGVSLGYAGIPVFTNSLVIPVETIRHFLHRS